MSNLRNRTSFLYSGPHDLPGKSQTWVWFLRNDFRVVFGDIPPSKIDVFLRWEDVVLLFTAVYEARQAPWNARPSMASLMILWRQDSQVLPGIVGCTQIPTYPYGKSLYKPYIVGMGYNPQESLENTYHGYTLRGRGRKHELEMELSYHYHLPRGAEWMTVWQCQKKHHPFRFKQHPAWKMLVGDFTVRNSWQTDAER